MNNIIPRIAGRACSTTFLMEDEEIPGNSGLVITTAMRSLLVTSSHLSQRDEEQVKDLIRFMGGNYSNHIHEKCTHLVTNTVRSSKYEKAVKFGMEIMTLDWVHAVWEVSIKENVHAMDKQFLKYKCPIFHGLEITVSDLHGQQKRRIRELINKNGGKYNPELSKKTTTLIVSRKPEGKMYKHAKCWKIPSVKPDWIFECLEKEHAVEFSKYKTSATISSSASTNSNVDFTHSSGSLWSGSYADCSLTLQNVTNQPQILQTIAKPLVGCVLTVSNYNSKVRNLIREKGEGLGASVQEQLVRRSTGDLAASTHLICPTPDGPKFEASVKWKLPAVTVAWIADCAKAGRKLPVDSYLVKQPKDTPDENKEVPVDSPTSSDSPMTKLRKVLHNAMQNINEKLPLIEPQRSFMYLQKQVFVRKISQRNYFPLSQSSEIPRVGWTDPVEVLQREKDQQEELKRAALCP